jgi:[FeFe] hydrogenase (group B1/B3)
MFHQATEIRRDLLKRVCELSFDNRLKEEIDRIPVEMRPKASAITRCCIHKDRAVIKYRLMTILGFNVSDEEDELTPLSEYAAMSEKREEFTDVMLTVVDEACSSCVKHNYTVTNLCRACVGRPCTYACNKNAIRVTNKAEIDQSLCVNCGRCLAACPFNAIVYTPVPCEEACPVGAISKDRFGVEHIDWDKCVYCGLCKEACPYGAIMEKTYLVQIIRDIMNKGKRVKAMVAPAIVGQYNAPPGRIFDAVCRCGFDDVAEVAAGANITSKNEAREWEERVAHDGASFMTTSCCPSYTRWAHKELPEIVPYISHTRTPVSYLAEKIKMEDPDATTVFIGPCIAKRVEGFHDENIDYVMTFEELDAMFSALGIIVGECDDRLPDENIEKSGRQFARSGGVSSSVAQYVKDDGVLDAVALSGLNRENIT